MSNSSPRSVAPLVLEPGPSRRVRLITLGGFLLTLLSVALLPLPLSLLAAGELLLLGAFVFAWQRHPALSGQAVTLSLDSDGQWLWQQGARCEQVELLGDSYLAPFLVILNFRPQGSRRPLRTILLTSDNIDADLLRRLRVHLKWQEHWSDHVQ